MSRSKKFWNDGRWLKVCSRPHGSDGHYGKSDFPFTKENYKWREHVDSSFAWNTKRPLDEWRKCGKHKQMCHQIERAWERDIVQDEVKDYWEDKYQDLIEEYE